MTNAVREAAERLERWLANEPSHTLFDDISTVLSALRERGEAFEKIAALAADRDRLLEALRLSTDLLEEMALPSEVNTMVRADVLWERIMSRARANRKLTQTKGRPNG